MKVEEEKEGRNGEKWLKSLAFSQPGRIGSHAWIVQYAMKGVQPVLPGTLFIDRNGQVFRPEAKALSELLRVEEKPTRADAKFVDRFLRLLNGETSTILNELPEADQKRLKLNTGEKIRPPEWVGDTLYHFYAHQEMGGRVYRCKFRYEPGGDFLNAEVTLLGREIEPCNYYR